MDKKITAVALLLIFGSMSGFAQMVSHDVDKRKQWQSMETGPWDFSPDWYYYIMHKKYSGGESYWKWAGFKSGLRIRFKEHKSNVKTIMPDRVLSEETQRQKMKKAEVERQKIEELYKEDVARQADRMVDLTYSAYKEEFKRMQERITDGLLYCMTKSKGKLSYQVNELSRLNKVLCSDIAYIHKSGIGNELENAKRQQAYEEFKKRMEELLGRTARLCSVAATHY
jgi:hypothetical protein bacD2_21897